MLRNLSAIPLRDATGCADSPRGACLNRRHPKPARYLAPAQRWLAP